MPSEARPSSEAADQPIETLRTVPVRTEEIRLIGEFVIAGLTVIAAVIVFATADGRPETEAALVGIAGAAVGAVMRGRMS